MQQFHEETQKIYKKWQESRKELDLRERQKEPAQTTTE